MKKVVAILVVVSLLASLLLSGCGTKQQSEQSTQGTQGTGVTTTAAPEVKLKFIKVGTQQSDTDMYVERINEFKKIKPNVTIEIDSAPVGNEINQKLNVAFASGAAPDIMDLALSTIAERAGRNQYAPIDEFMNKWEDKGDVFDSLLELGKYNGKSYGLPYNPSPSLMVYRKDFFREAGLDPEKAPETWDEILNAAEKTVKKENGKITRAGMAIPIDSTQLLITLARINGSDLFDSSGKLNCDDPKFIEAVEFMNKLYKTSIPTNMKNENNQPLFAQDMAAMSLVTKLPILANMVNSRPELEKEIGFIFPKVGSETGAWSACYFLFMSEPSKHKDEAWEFMKFCLNKENVQKGFEKYAKGNVRKTLVEDFTNANPFMNAAVTKAISVGAGANKVVDFPTVSSQYLPKAIQEVYFGRKTAEQAMKDMKKEFEGSKADSTKK